MSRDERRDGDRIPILGELTGGVMVFQPMTVTEIGVGGMQIEMRSPLQLDSLHDFRLPLDDRPVVLKGRVVHCRISDVDTNQVLYRTGIEFIDPPEHARKAIEKYIKTMKSARRSS
ncbi:MAG TPA: PilZ domain-containing protein [Vicinamibacterales bacterium]|nr:PilZ domain-containing protein [Vicinamibacterales bacterium]